MSNNQHSPFLRNALLIDAVASGGTGLLMIAGAGLLEGLLGLPAALLRGAGLVLVPYVAFVVWTGTREPIPGAAVWAIIVANAAWAIASVFLLIGSLTPTLLGTSSSSARRWWWRCWASCSTWACSGPLAAT